jgi:hypothetical protein
MWIHNIQRRTTPSLRYIDKKLWEPVVKYDNWNITVTGRSNSIILDSSFWLQLMKLQFSNRTMDVYLVWEDQIKIEYRSKNPRSREQIEDWGMFNYDLVTKRLTKID